jgi:hypothetical protein
MTNTEHQRREATSWAAATLTRKGCKLYPVQDGWDVEYPDGSWAPVNDWRELCAIARDVNKELVALLKAEG